MNEIQNRARKALSDYLNLRRYFSTRPLNEAGNMLLKILETTAQQIMKARANAKQEAALEEDVTVLEAMMSDSPENIYNFFKAEAATLDYGIEFCQRGIDALQKREARLVNATGVGFDKSSPEYIQLENFRTLLKRFSGEKERGAAPSYSPKAYEQFA